ncbi:hypothetical protein [Kocuria sp.]|uniref:hypothetical protein n=1 Tax=Kocuria sp. TaxID=1871328 RepID=UPI0026E082C2|nr:hypothetical protein [Kocuria sp.]MDO5617855.1 hypothetical protein [Kocuria sp.]
MTSRGGTHRFPEPAYWKWRTLVVKYGSFIPIIPMAMVGMVGGLGDLPWVAWLPFLMGFMFLAFAGPRISRSTRLLGAQHDPVASAVVHDADSSYWTGPIPALGPHNLNAVLTEISDGYRRFKLLSVSEDALLATVSVDQSWNSSGSDITVRALTDPTDGQVRGDTITYQVVHGPDVGSLTGDPLRQQDNIMRLVHLMRAVAALPPTGGANGS